MSAPAVLPQIQTNPRTPVVVSVVAGTANWEGRKIEPMDQDALPFNFFSDFPKDIFERHLAPCFTPKEAWLARHVCQDFARIFTLNTIWDNFYHACGLEAPAISNEQNNILNRGFVDGLPLWVHLKRKELDSAIQSLKRQVIGKSVFLRSIYIAILTLPEMKPLHDYAINSLKTCCHISISDKQSIINLIMMVIKQKKIFEFSLGTCVLAIRFLSTHADQPEVRKTLLSIVVYDLNATPTGSQIMAEAVRGLVPYLSEPKVLDKIKLCLDRFGPFAIKPAADVLITDPEFFNLIVDNLNNESHHFLDDYLSDEVVVNLLLQRFHKEDCVERVLQLTQILKTIAHLKSVQQTFCQKYLHESFQSQAAIPARHLIEAGVLNQLPFHPEVIREYQQNIQILQKQANTHVILGYNVYDPHERQNLLSAFTGPNEFEREAAATVLAPLVSHDAEVREVFINGIDTENYIRVMSAMANAAYHIDIRNALISRYTREKSLSSFSFADDPVLRLAIMKTLLTFVHEPEVQVAFLDWLDTDRSPNIKCALLDALANQLEREDVLNLFLKTAAKPLQTHVYSRKDFRVTAIDHLRSIAGQPRVQQVLLQAFKEGTGPVRAACIRALCQNPHQRLIKMDQILFGCVNLPDEVQAEALRVFVSWMKT